MIGITGTDGKSTIALLAVEMLRATGRHRPGLIGTVAVGIGSTSEVRTTSRATTPEALELQELLAQMVAAGNDSAMIEATSHGLALERTRNCRFDVGVVTSVTSEHLEFHGTLEAYRAAKALLFEEAPVAVLNADDPAVGFFRSAPAVSSATPSRPMRTCAPPGSRPTRRERGSTLASPRWSGSVTVRDAGTLQRLNALAVLGIGQALGVDLDRAGAALADTSGVPGRMERIDAGQPFTVIVDYAHTADCAGQGAAILRRIRRAGSSPCSARPGSATPTKRAPMGHVAARARPISSSSPTRTRASRTRARSTSRSPAALATPVPSTARRCGSSTIDARRSRTPSASPRDGDVILLAGKGHEASIFYGTETRPWDDRRVAREALAASGWGSAE